MAGARPIGNRRYSRMEFCATKAGHGRSHHPFPARKAFASTDKGVNSAANECGGKALLRELRSVQTTICYPWGPDACSGAVGYGFDLAGRDFRNVERVGAGADLRCDKPGFRLRGGGRRASDARLVVLWLWCIDCTALGALRGSSSRSGEYGLVRWTSGLRESTWNKHRSILLDNVCCICPPGLHSFVGLGS